jgi:protein-tyrosine phosphatase
VSETNQFQSPARSGTRVPNFKGALNFRDMGGYRTTDGRHVLWNKLYRSGTTHAMTEQELALAIDSGIKYAYDFRSNSERREQPSRFHGIADVEYEFRDHERVPGDITRLIRANNIRADECRDMMVKIYRSLPYDFKDAYGILFRRLANGDLPLVFNCTAGKDRTGVAAALVLTALGVPRELVDEDYLLTAQFFERSCELILDGPNRALFARVERAVWEPLLRTDPAYLAAMFETLNAAHGSVPNYLRDELGVDQPMIEKLRANLLGD